MAANEKPDIFHEHTYYSACRPVREGPGRHSRGVGVFVSSRVNIHVQLVKAAADASYVTEKGVPARCTLDHYCNVSSLLHSPSL